MDEALAINAFTRQRSIQFLGSIFAVVDPAGAKKAVSQFRGVVFPEDKNDDLDYIKKSRELMKKIAHVNFTITPIKAKTFGGSLKDVKNIER